MPATREPARTSIARRLGISLMGVGLFGALLLLLFIGIEYRISFSNLSNESAFRQAMHELAEHVLLPMVVLILPMALAGLWALRRGMRPLAEAAERIDTARGGERGFRIDDTTFPVETVPFVKAVNNLLGRVDAAAAAQEAFAADVAHELRTPLTLLTLELDRLDTPDARRLKADVAAMRRLIDQLMLMAQIEAEQAAHIPPAALRLSELADETVARMAPDAIRHGRTVALEVEDDATVPGRREALSAALRNLVENALRVTAEGEAVTVFVGPGATLRVRDHGPGLSPQRLRDLVARLRRADHASATGAGLGLAIVARIMAAHGGTLSTDPSRRELILTFPPAAPRTD